MQWVASMSGFLTGWRAGRRDRPLPCSLGVRGGLFVGSWQLFPVSLRMGRRVASGFMREEEKLGSVHPNWRSSILHAPISNHQQAQMYWSRESWMGSSEKVRSGGRPQHELYSREIKPPRVVAGVALAHRYRTGSMSCSKRRSMGADWAREFQIHSPG